MAASAAAERKRRTSFSDCVVLVGVYLYMYAHLCWQGHQKDHKDIGKAFGFCGFVCVWEQ